MGDSDGIAVEIEAPTLHRLYAYWRERCGGALWARRADIDPVDLPVEVLPRMFLADVVGEPPDFRYRLAGTEFVERVGLEVTGRLLSELPLKGLDRIIEEYRLVVREQRPRHSISEYVSAEGYERRVERLLLPLSRQGDRLDMLMGAFVYHR